MKSKIFYDHLILIEEIEFTLTTHMLTREECEEILAIVDKTMHSEIIQTILKHLPTRHHEAFLTRLHATPHDPSIMAFLKEHVVVDIEKEILRTAQKVKRTVMKELEQAKIRK